MILGYRHHSKITFKELQEKCLRNLREVYNPLGLKKEHCYYLYALYDSSGCLCYTSLRQIRITHSMVFRRICTPQLAIRIEDCNSKVIITASAGVEVKRIPYLPFVKKHEMSSHKPRKYCGF